MKLTGIQITMSIPSLILYTFYTCKTLSCYHGYGQIIINVIAPSQVLI